MYANHKNDSHKDNDKIIQYFKDDATAFNKKKHEIISDKGIINNFISEYIFKYLSENSVSNHFIERINEREQLVKKVEIIPIEVIIRNIATGTLSKRLGIKEGLKLERPLIEFTLKDDELDDPIVSEEHLDILGFTQKDEIKKIKEQSLKINYLLSDLFSDINIELVDFNESRTAETKPATTEGKKRTRRSRRKAGSEEKSAKQEANTDIVEDAKIVDEIKKKKVNEKSADKDKDEKK